MSKSYSFIIDTDQYAGNFEREMGAYVTGQIGECGVGDDIAERFKEQFPKEFAEFEEIIRNEMDDHGCGRPVSLCYTPGRFGFSFVHESFSEDKELDMDLVRLKHVEGVKRYYEPHLKNAQKALDQGKTEWQNTVDDYTQKIKDSHTKPLEKHSVNESVKIHFSSRPSDKQIEFMKQRAYSFPKDAELQKGDRAILHRGYPNISILGFRLEEEVTTSTVTTI